MFADSFLNLYLEEDERKNKEGTFLYKHPSFHQALFDHHHLSLVYSFPFFRLLFHAFVLNLCCAAVESYLNLFEQNKGVICRQYDAVMMCADVQEHFCKPVFCFIHPISCLYPSSLINHKHISFCLDKSILKGGCNQETTAGCLTQSSVHLFVYQGATIRRDEGTGEIFIARVIHGGLADRSGEIRYLISYVVLSARGGSTSKTEIMHI